MINRLSFQILIHLPIVLTNMLSIPPITPSSILSIFPTRETSRCALQRNVPRTHDSLP